MANPVIIPEDELDKVAGGAGGSPMPGAGGSFVSYGSYLVYTAAAGETLSELAPRFGVTVQQLRQWNSIKDRDALSFGQKLMIYTGRP